MPLLSSLMTTGLEIFSPLRSARSLDSHMASFVAVQHATYSASQDDVATTDCFFDFQLTGPPASRNMYPLVDFRVIGQPA